MTGARGARLARCCCAAVLAALGCTADPVGRGLCDLPRRAGSLPGPIDESSGVAASRRRAGVLWTHNDSGGGPFLFAVDTAGRLLGRVRVTGVRNRDWEDIAAGPCPAGDCLYIADTGDNDEERDDIAIYRVPEPDPTDSATAPAERFPIRYPGGPRDVEALFVTADGALHLISKGRSAAAGVFRYAPPQRAGETVELERIATLGAAPRGLPDQITGADAAPGGHWVAVRTYTAVQIYRVGRRGRLRPLLDEPGIDVQPLAEPQGEGIAVRADGTIVLTSEGGAGDTPGTISLVTCRLD